LNVVHPCVSSTMRKVLGCLGALTLVTGKIYFSETFGDDWETRWTASTGKEDEGSQGKWSLASGKWSTDDKEDRGIQTAEDSKFFQVSAGFDSFSNEGKELIVQYQAKYEKDIECGGGYLKIGPKMDDPAKFGDPTVYNIMFGPDKCGYTKRTHLIFNYKGTNVLKKADLDYKQEGEGTSHLYRMILKPDNTVRVEIDQEKIYEGSVKEDWEVLKPKTIDDPEDKKPSDWVEDSMMDDPEDKKPEDWATEKRIIDSDAKKPDDWDDEEDGEWEAPMKDNPAFKGDWSVKKISNPAYKGFWEAKKIDNPEYEDDNEVYKSADFGFIGFDLWQVKGGTIFDNVIVCDDVAEADVLAAKWKALSEHEKAAKTKEDAAKKAEDEAKAAADTKAADEKIEDEEADDADAETKEEA
jgi:calreticulin